VRREVDEGYYLIRQGDPPEGVYFIADGGATAQLEYGEGEVTRLRKMEAGTVVEEIGLYAGTEATASVVIDQPSTIYYLSAERLEAMEETDPQTAAVFHGLIAQILSERLVDATDTIQALLR
jgi:SulP family sulfate permease